MGSLAADLFRAFDWTGLLRVIASAHLRPKSPPRGGENSSSSGSFLTLADSAAALDDTAPVRTDRT